VSPQDAKKGKNSRDSMSIADSRSLSPRARQAGEQVESPRGTSARDAPRARTPLARGQDGKQNPAEVESPRGTNARDGEPTKPSRGKESRKETRQDAKQLEDEFQARQNTRPNQKAESPRGAAARDGNRAPTPTPTPRSDPLRAAQGSKKDGRQGSKQGSKQDSVEATLSAKPKSKATAKPKAAQKSASEVQTVREQSPALDSPQADPSELTFDDIFQVGADYEAEEIEDMEEFLSAAVEWTFQDKDAVVFFAEWAAYEHRWDRLVHLFETDRPEYHFPTSTNVQGRQDVSFIKFAEQLRLMGYGQGKAARKVVYGGLGDETGRKLQAVLLLAIGRFGGGMAGFSKMMSKLDNNGDGTLSAEEFEQVIRHRLEVSEAALSSQEIQAFVTSLDHDGSGEVDAEELVEFLTSGNQSQSKGGGVEVNNVEPQGIAIKKIFTEIGNECLNARDRYNKFKDPQGQSSIIALRQLKRFQQRCLQINRLPAEDDTIDVVGLFRDQLLKSRGTVLRAWRLDLDCYGTGNVGYHEFGKSCRELNLGGQVKTIWRALTEYTVQVGGTSLLTFDQLCKSEGENLEKFAELLWHQFGLDLDKAWAALDVRRKNFITCDDFCRIVQEWGFKGSKKLVYKGLDSSGLDRMSHADLKYIQKVSKIAARQLEKSSYMVHELVTWVQHQFGGPTPMIAQLGLTRTNPEISVVELAARLTALGFNGDALNVACRAARFDGGTSVSADSLHLVLSGGRRPLSVVNRERRQTPPRKVEAAKKTPAFGFQAWDSSVDTTSMRNRNKPACVRTYFSQSRSILAPQGKAPYGPQEAVAYLEGLPPQTVSAKVLRALDARGKPQETSSRSSSARPRSLTPRGNRLSILPERAQTLRKEDLVEPQGRRRRGRARQSWNGDVAVANNDSHPGATCKYTRGYFTDMDKRPVRDKMLQGIKDRSENRPAGEEHSLYSARSHRSQRSLSARSGGSSGRSRSATLSPSTSVRSWGCRGSDRESHWLDHPDSDASRSRSRARTRSASPASTVNSNRGRSARRFAEVQSSLRMGPRGRALREAIRNSRENSVSDGAREGESGDDSDFL